ncbi:MAG: Bug family tripartite tricarboxylate transporter substrate binding protein [Gemmatimonas sp.]
MLSASSGSPRRVPFTSVLSAALALAVPSLAAAQQTDRFYDGKRVSLLVGFSAGGGYDVYARAVAQHMARFLGRDTTIIVQNMPGAGSLVAANNIANLAPKDGTSFAVLSRSAPLDPLLDGKASKFDPRQVGWVGSLGREVNVTVVWHTVPVKTPEDLRTRGMISGGTGSGGDSVVNVNLLNQLAGAKIKLIMGYPGANEVNLAMERGEVEGRGSPSWSSLKVAVPQWIETGKIRPIWQLGLKRHDELPEVPLVIDLVTDPEARQVMELFFARQEMSRPFMAPGGLPPGRLALMRQAFEKMAADAQFQAFAAQQSLEADLVTGAEMDALIARVYTAPDAVLARARAISTATAVP